MRAIMGALNRVYGAEENRPFVRRMILSFGLALVTPTALGPGDRDAAAGPRLLARQNRTRHVESQNRRRSVRASTIAAPQARQRGDHRASSPKSICTSAVIRLVSASTASTSSGDSRSWSLMGGETLGQTRTEMRAGQPEESQGSLRLAWRLQTPTPARVCFPGVSDGAAQRRSALRALDRLLVRLAHGRA